MTNPFKNRNVQLAAAICLPLVAVHAAGVADLGYFLFVPVITLAVITFAAATGASLEWQDSSNG